MDSISSEMLIEGAEAAGWSVRGQGKKTKTPLFTEETKLSYDQNWHQYELDDLKWSFYEEIKEMENKLLFLVSSLKRKVRCAASTSISKLKKELEVGLERLRKLKEDLELLQFMNEFINNM